MSCRCATAASRATAADSACHVGPCASLSQVPGGSPEHGDQEEGGGAVRCGDTHKLQGWAHNVIQIGGLGLNIQMLQFFSGEG